jgi:hypothetical protein
MKKFWKGYRKPRDEREREERQKIRRELRERLSILLRTGGHEAEPEYVATVKQVFRDVFGREIEKDELIERIRRFHDAVNERKSLDRGSS